MRQSATQACIGAGSALVPVGHPVICSIRRVWFGNVCTAVSVAAYPNCFCVLSRPLAVQSQVEAEKSVVNAITSLL